MTPGALVVSQHDAPILKFTGEKIGDVKRVFIEGHSPFNTDYDDAKKILTVRVPEDVTKTAAKRKELQFRDGEGKLLATLAMEVRELPKPAKQTAAATQPQ